MSQPHNSGQPRNSRQPRRPQSSKSASPAAQRKRLAQLVAGAIVVVILLLAVFLLSRCGSQGAPAAGTSHSSAAKAHSSSHASQKSQSASKQTGSSQGRAPVNPSKLPAIKESKLPSQAQNTLALIRKGGPYPYDRDGINFGNFEGVLPHKSGGYYSEYTVKTPGESDRGARRIIVGKSGEKYYTDDHYESFSFIQEGS